MSRSRVRVRDGARPGVLALALALLQWLALAAAGPLSAPGTVTSQPTSLLSVVDAASGCTLGDAVHRVGEQFAGAGACERCTCSEDGAVRCARQRCEPRPGCKAVHRPDHCCPTYQCECEQEGRLYANGEKLVDPRDPCRVCYCQGGEVVCRRIACFQRDDCRPRHVPGRCCPEYDHCPLRGASVAAEAPPAAVPDEQNSKQKITIKEITPVSEIPAITDNKIKGPPSPTGDGVGVDSASPATPLVPHGAGFGADGAGVTDATKTHATEHLSTSRITEAVVVPQTTSPAAVDAATPTVGPARQEPSSTAASVAAPSGPSHDEEDPMLFEHSPAFPPLPDDLSVPADHEDEAAFEIGADGGRAPLAPPSTAVANPTGAPVAETTTIDHVIAHLGTAPLTRSDPSSQLRSAVEMDLTVAPSAHTSRSPERDTDTDTGTRPPDGVQGADGARTVITENATAPESLPSNVSVEDASTVGDPPDRSAAPPAQFDMVTVAVAADLGETLATLPAVPRETSAATQAERAKDATAATEHVEFAESATTTASPHLNKNNVLTDLINLVGDVASISEHAEPPATAAIAESEELILVSGAGAGAGYKSKNSHRTVNSIAEVGGKEARAPAAARGPSGGAGAGAGVELEDEAESDTDAPTATHGDRAEPTTRRPLIDRVTAGAQPHRSADDIEIIAQSRSASRRPTKVLLGSTAAP